MKKILIIPALIVVAGCFVWFGSSYWIDGSIGGGGMEQYAPDAVQAGEPVDITLFVTATGGGGNIQGRFTKLSLHYRLVGEKAYRSLQPQSITLPDNLKTVQSKTFQSEAYKFTIPAYPKGTTGEIEYYTEMTFDGYRSRQEGVKKIKIIPSPVSLSMSENDALKSDPFEWCMSNGGENRTPNYNAPKVCILNSKVYEESCVGNDKYFVIESKLTDSVGANHLTKYKTDGNQNFDCKYVVEKGDFEIRNERAEYTLALENNFLILDSGTGPTPRGFIAYDLNLRKKVYEDSYSQPINIQNNLVDYWTVTTKPVTEQNCPEFKKWEERGLGSVIDARVSLNLSTLIKKELGEYRCSAVSSDTVSMGDAEGVSGVLLNTFLEQVRTQYPNFFSAPVNSSFEWRWRDPNMGINALPVITKIQGKAISTAEFSFQDLIHGEQSLLFQIEKTLPTFFEQEGFIQAVENDADHPTSGSSVRGYKRVKDGIVCLRIIEDTESEFINYRISCGVL